MQVDILKMRKAIKQVDAIFALEGFTPNAQERAIDEAVLAGRVTNAQVVSELVEYARVNKSMNGFIETRIWR